jgi:peptidylprolyl isomerase domain and WD repeat-containing protein 1
MSKRPADDEDVDVGPPRPPASDDDEDDADVGPPRPPPEDAEEGGAEPGTAAPAHKKRKAALEFEQLYLENLPVSEMYEKSYMHRDVVTDLIVTPNEFIITASCDGQVRLAARAPRLRAGPLTRPLPTV